MTPTAILLNVQDETGEGSYRFLCPSCLDPVEKPADRKIVALLISAGVDFSDPLGEQGTLEAPEHGHPGPRYDGPPFTPDDLIEFHFMLQNDEEIARLLFA